MVPANAQDKSFLGGDPPISLGGLYIHIPFCETKCGYCDFYSLAVKDRDTSPLVSAVIRELASRVSNAPVSIRTVFCGGGTPTVLPLPPLARLMEAVKGVVAREPVIEFTVEANPATVEDVKARLLVDAGVTRVSMGAQSFFPGELATLERIHSPEDIAPSVKTLRRCGVTQINLDLIFGIPGQTGESWGESLRRAIALHPDHIACYGLTYEPGTRLTSMREHGRLAPCNEDLEADLYLYAVDALSDAGFEQYETSNFAKPGCRCEHNLIYWRNQPYIGVGPSAAGCYVGRRYKNIADVNGYVRMIESSGRAERESESISRDMLMLEMLMMQLRLVEGLSLRDFHERIGQDVDVVFGDVLHPLLAQSLLMKTKTHLALTRSGRLVADAVLRELARVGSVGPRPPSSTSLPVLS